MPTKNSVKLTGVENTEAWLSEVGVTSEVQAHFTAVGGQLREWFGAASKEQDTVVVFVNYLKSEISKNRIVSTCEIVNGVKRKLNVSNAALPGSRPGLSDEVYKLRPWVSR